MSTISYLVTCCNETNSLKNLLKTIYDSIQYDDVHSGDEIVIIVDSVDTYGDDVPPETADILYEYTGYSNVTWNTHPLNKDYGTHKNFGIEQCSGNWVCQIDGDECLPESLLGENLHALIDSNPTIEAYAVPRINAWEGLTPEHAKQWGWSLDMSPTYKRLRAAWPDYQLRLFKNTPSIRFKNRLHERIEGYKSIAALPATEEWALYHDKTIETQIQTNLRYNEWFSAAENAGVSNKVS